MASLKVKLVASLEGRNPTQKATVAGLGLRKMNQERLLQDTPAIRGMIERVQHMVAWEAVQADAPKRQRTGGKKKAAQAENK